MPYSPAKRPHARAPRSRSFSPDPNPERPHLNRMMALVDAILERSEGKLTKTGLAQDIGSTQAAISEWMGCRRSAPSGEPTLQIFLWAARHDRGFIKAFLS